MTDDDYKRVQAFACKTIAEISPEQDASQGNSYFGIIGLIVNLCERAEKAEAELARHTEATLSPPTYDCTECGEEIVVNVSRDKGRRTEATGQAREIIEDIMLTFDADMKVPRANEMRDALVAALTAHTRAAVEEDRKQRTEATGEARDDKSAINKEVAARYDELVHKKHGHYETMFKIVHEQRRAAEERAARAEEILDWLDRRGGLGFDAHSRIERIRALRGQSAALSAGDGR